MNDMFSDIYGNENLKALFAGCITSGKLSHAYMPIGPAGSGKKTLARAVAAALSVHNGDEKEVTDRIASGHSPDIFMLSSQDKRIGVDDVRDFTSSIYLTPNELDFKMYIFDRADAMTTQAQNALLKVIEEPPKNVYIFLCAEDPAMLLPTVRSRVIALNMETFDAEQIKGYIGDRINTEVSRERLDFAFKMSGGAIGALEALVSEENIEFDAYKTAERVIMALYEKNRGITYFDFLVIVTSFAENGERLVLLLKYLSLIYRDILLALSDEEYESTLIEYELSEKFASVFAVRTVISSLELIEEIKKNMKFNTNIATTGIYLAENLWRKT